MKINKNKNTKKSIQSSYFLNDVILKHKDLFLGLFVICGIAVMSVVGNTEWFRASILQIPEKFNGTTEPIASVPNWAEWGGNNHTTKYYEIDPKNLIDLPSYSLAIGGSGPSDIIENSSEKMAKITYAIVYGGNYSVNNRKELSGSHPAIDIVVPVGTPVMSIANGKVIKAVEQNSGFGRHIVVEMPNVPDYPNSNKKTTFYASYSHLNEILVNEGDIVKKGQIIGRSGQSGTSTTPHLHFQIDRDDTEWHPYWPFTTKEAYAANLDFFSAVRNGLGQENTIKYTINPMKWVEANLNNVSGNDVVGVGQDFEKFNIVGNNEFAINSSLTLNIVAEDENGRVIESFVPSSDISVTSSSSNARFSKNLKFRDGIASLIITNRAVEKFDFVIKKGDQEFSKVIKSTEVQEEAEVNTEDLTPQEVVGDGGSGPDTSTTAKDDTEPKKDESKVKEVIPDEAKVIDNNVKIMFAGENNVEVGDTVIIDVFLNDLNGSFADVVRDYAVYVAGVGDVNQHVLMKEDFIGSKAKLAYKSDKVGTSIITINNEDFDINVKEKTKEEVAVVNKEEVASNAGTSDVEIADEIDAVEPQTETEDSPIFIDLNEGHKNYEAIKYLKEIGAVGGYPDGSFKPNKVVSRVEALKMIFASLKVSLANKSELPFTDTDGSAWYAEYVGAALSKGIVKGYDDGSFKPAKEVNRAEYYKILLLSSGVSIEEEFSDPYVDVPADSWFGKFVNFVKINKLTDAVGSFYPTEGVTRSEVSESIYRLIKVMGL